LNQNLIAPTAHMKSTHSEPISYDKTDNVKFYFGG